MEALEVKYLDRSFSPFVEEADLVIQSVQCKKRSKSLSTGKK